MKYKDLMLDLATGDASSNDPYIAEAAGQVRVASAYFEAASIINALAESNELEVVQEAANAGLPTDEKGSASLGCEAVKKGMEGLFKVIRETADKVKKQADKDMKILLTIGKKYGVSAPGESKNFESDFAQPLAKAIFSKPAPGSKKDSSPIILPNLQYIKAKYADEIAKNYVKGMCSLVHAYGYDITEIFNDGVIAKELNKKYAKSGECETIGCVAEALSDGAKLMNFGELNKDKHYNDGIKVGDIAAVATDLYMILVASTAVVDALKGQDKSAKANIDKIFADCNTNEKKINKQVAKIGDNMNDWTKVVQSTTSTITTAFTDSVYSLSEALSK